MKTLLLEIGVEEMPARFIPSAMDQLASNGLNSLMSARLEPGTVNVSATPRRLALRIDDIPDNQPDQIREVKGPPVKAAFDADGNPTRAAEGFAKGQGVPLAALYTKVAEGGEYVFARVEDKGRPAMDVLKQVLPELIVSLSFPKAMRWANLDLRWARPIRWIVALLGPDIIEFEFAGLRSGRNTYGLRFLHPDPIAIPDPSQHAALLRSAEVILDQQERRKRIHDLVLEAAAAEGGRVDESDEELFEEVTNINEFPSVVVGRFDRRYLELPPEAVITPMRHHQRYFPVYGNDGRLLPLFITIRNGRPDEKGYVRRGNEKVLAARLADASFFYEEDRKIRLEDRLPRLETLVFQEKLGTMRERVERLAVLAPSICESLGGTPEDCTAAARAAQLSKSDLVSSMVFEFPELQGIMGSYYALADGESPEVARAIDEQYRPRHAGGELPETPAGCALALADKLDALAGFFGVGLVPSGSQDPFALRRAALGAIAILRSSRRSINLEQLAAKAYSMFTETAALRNDQATTVGMLNEFFRARMRVALVDEGLRYDLVDAALGAGELDPFTLVQMATALQALSGTPEFGEALGAFTRAANLAAKAETDRVDPGALPEEADRVLLEACRKAETELNRAVERGDIPGAVAALAALKTPVDTFFGQVLVMAADENVRRSRLAMLKAIVGLFNRLADWSKIVSES